MGNTFGAAFAVSINNLISKTARDLEALKISKCSKRHFHLEVIGDSGALICPACQRERIYNSKWPTALSLSRLQTVLSKR